MGSVRLGRRIIASAPVLLCVGLLLSCDVALDTTATKAKEPEILSVSLEQGAVLKPGDLIEITAALPDTASEATPATGTEGEATPEAAAPVADTAASPYSVEVQLETSAGVLITSRSFPYHDGDVLAPLTLDDLGLESQGYRLIVRLMHGLEELASRIVDFTYLGDEYELREITSDAPSIHPGSTVTLTAVLTAPEGSNPYMEWSWAEGVFAKGNLLEGLDTVQWTSPPVEGIYTITARLYPLGAESASVPLSADIYVSVVKDPLGELGPPTSYRGLYHLLGDLEDSSPEMASGSFLEGTQPLQLITRGRIVGYRLDGVGGFFVPVSLLPERDGLLEPFTVSFGFTPPQEPTVGRLLRVATADGQLELTVDLTDISIVAEMRSAEATRRIEAAASSLKAGMRSSLSFSLSHTPLPAANAAGVPAPVASGRTQLPLTARWFVDGYQVASAEWSPAPPIGNPQGTTTIGGPESAQGLLDELGVYVRDEAGRAATDPDILFRCMAEEYGASTVADGFDGMYLAADYIAEGAVGVAQGNLELGAGSTLRLPAYGLAASGCRIRLTLPATLGPAARLTLSWAGEGETEGSILTLSGGGELRWGEVVETCAFSASPELVFSLRPEGEELQVAIEGLTRSGGPLSFSIPLGGLRDAGILLGLANGAEAGTPLLVDSLSFRPLQ